jgi:hypothetical protein
MHLSKDIEDAALIIDAASSENAFLLDAPNIACNSGEVHKVTFYDTLPKAELQGYNIGVGSNTSQVQGKTEGIAKLGIYSAVDKSLAEAGGNARQIYNFEARTHIEGMGRQMADIILYGNKNKTPLSIDGLATRYRKKKSPYFIPFKELTAKADNITSLYICALGPKNLHLLHNPNSGSIGVKREDRGYQDWVVTSGTDGAKRLLCHVDFFSAHFGLAVEHPDSVYCIGNIPTTGMSKDDREKLIDMVLHVQKLLPRSSTTKVMYGNLSVEELVEKAAREREVVVSPEKDPWGNPVNLINGMRVRRMDSIETGGDECVLYPVPGVQSVQSGNGGEVA